MFNLFNLHQWIDFFRQDVVWNTAAILFLGAGAVLLVLYSDRLKQWRGDRRERAKWLHWNRPRS